MALDFTETGSPRRRRATNLSDNSSTLLVQSGSGYSDSDDEEGGNAKHPRHHSAQTYGAACSLGKFFLNPCLCLTRSVQICFQNVLQPIFAPLLTDKWQRSSQRPRRFSRENRFLGFLLVVFFVTVLWLLKSDGDENQWISRPRSDWHLERIPVTIGLFNFTQIEDVGGWIYGAHRFATLDERFSLANILDSEDVSETDGVTFDPDYGGLLFDSLADASISNFKRRINPKDDDTYEEERRKQLKEMDSHKVSFYYLHDDEIEFVQKECRRPNWKSAYYPNCNSFHEFDLSRSVEMEVTTNVDVTDYQTFYFSHGYFRDAWGLNTRSKDNVVLKTLRTKEHKFDHRAMYNVLKDAVVMERLTSSPRIVDIYGHCATSVQVERVLYEVQEFIVPGEGTAKQDELDDSQDVNPKNSYTVEEKLQIALDMAESLADLHGFKDGVIVHDDVQPCQWLRAEDGKVKLGDFNRAEIMNWSEEKQAYCKHNNGEGFGEYRAPEEFAALDLDEQIDVFSFGNNIYALLTGLWVYYTIDDDGVKQDKVIAGELPYVDDRYRNRSFGEGRLVSLMEKCWEHDPSKRINIFDAVKFLQKTVEENARS